MNKTLSARDKGDIYWRKFKYYMQAIRDKKLSGSSKQNNIYMLKRISAARDTAPMESYVPEDMINGNEFKLRPPTATGTQALEDSITKVIINLRFFEGLLQQASADLNKSLGPILEKQLRELCQVLKKTLSIYFHSFGLDFENGQSIDTQKCNAAKMQLPKALEHYENTVKNFRLNTALRIVEDLKKKIPACTDKPDLSIFEEMIRLNPGPYLTHQKVIDSAMKQLYSLTEKSLQYHRQSDAIRRLIENADPAQIPVDFMTFPEILAEYENYLQEHLTSLEWVKKGCEDCVSYLLTGKNCSPLIANYIAAHWNIDIETISTDMPVRALPGFLFSEEGASDERACDLLKEEEVSEAIHSLTSFMDTHPELFRHQTIYSLLFESQDIPRICHTAKAVRNTLAKKIDKDDPVIPDELILADTIERITSMILEYRRDSENRTFKDLIQNYHKDILEMDYLFQERNSRACFDLYLSQKP